MLWRCWVVDLVHFEWVDEDEENYLEDGEDVVGDPSDICIHGVS
jgi:hypothetical protein